VVESGACPTCGRRRVVAVEEDVTLRVGRRRHRFERVPHERCLACGERVFGVEASQRFDAVALPTRQTNPRRLTADRRAGSVRGHERMSG
jgi:YgiT-type zinc finger domain-containing protein